MNKWIVVTTINPPQPAIAAISNLCVKDGWRCVVVGDKKTPVKWSANNIDYLSVEDQKQLYPQLSDMLPYNHYCRKNIGYLYAASKGAEVILETDDDNIPLANFGIQLNKKISGRLVGNATWVNVYKYFTNALIWPRGNPLDSIHEKGLVLHEEYATECPVQQYLADGDPDVDAIYRLLFKDEIRFEKNSPVLLEKGAWCSFNSQNTIFFREFFSLLYLPCFVSFRMTDIWRSFVAQAVLWSEGKCLSFSQSSVVQVRNQHNLMKDFKDEVDGYLSNREICEILMQASAGWTNSMSIKSRVFSAWSALNAEKYITDDEMDIVKFWMECLSDQA